MRIGHPLIPDNAAFFFRVCFLAMPGTAIAVPRVPTMITRIDADPTLGAITLRQLRDFISQLPEVGAADQPYQVLVQTGFAESSPVQCISLVGRGFDVMLQTAASLEAAPEG